MAPNGLSWYKGAYHAVLFMPLILTGKNRKYTDTPGGDSLFPPMSESVLMAMTFLLVLVGWVIFRADTLTDAWHYIVRMFTDFHFTGGLKGKRCLIFIALMLCIEWIQRKKSHTFDLPATGILKYRPVRWSLYICMIFIIFIFCGTQGQFIYFQF